MTASRPLAVYAITRHGIDIARRLEAAVPHVDLYVSRKLQALGPSHARPLPLPMGPLLDEIFHVYQGHVFIISVGAVVRMIAGRLRNKKVDPAVICVDDDARFAVCLLSGHVGRGNAFTAQVATALGAMPVITTASDVRGTLTVDILGRELGWTLDDPDRNVTAGCAAVVNEAPVLFVQETGEPDFWPLDRPLPPGVRYATSLDGVNPHAYAMLLIASDRDVAKSHPACWERAVIYRPRSLVLGMGCDKGTPFDLVQRGVTRLLDAAGLSLRSVKALATIDKKRDEPALRALAERNGWAFHDYPAETLDAVPGIETPSETVKKYVGTRGVAEPAALLSAGADRLLVPKQRYTEPGAGRSMTLAVARVPFDKRQQGADAPSGGQHG